MQDFQFELTEEEKKYLKGLVSLSILTHISGEEVEIPAPVTERLADKYGAFVTLKLAGELRGCIGNVQGTEELYYTIWSMARSAAFEDPRFPPVCDADEFNALDVEITILSPLEVCDNPDEIEVGRHGLLVYRPPHSGLLLPQVAVEWNWDRKTFLAQTCVKAGLPADAWLDTGTQIYWFQGEVF
ncbi:MAG: AmmeMemoRadiSam system protein A [Desulfovibrio sp.]